MQGVLVVASPVLAWPGLVWPGPRVSRGLVVEVPVAFCIQCKVTIFNTAALCPVSVHLVGMVGIAWSIYIHSCIILKIRWTWWHGGSDPLHLCLFWKCNHIIAYTLLTRLKVDTFHGTRNHHQLFFHHRYCLSIRRRRRHYETPFLCMSLELRWMNAWAEDIRSNSVPNHYYNTNAVVQWTE